MRQETLDLRVFFDTSILEIFVNERVALTTRIYPESSKCYGVQPFVEYKKEPRDGERARVVYLRAWELQPSIFYEA